MKTRTPLAELIGERMVSAGELEPGTVEYAKLLLLSCLGAMVAGSRMPAAQIISSYAATELAALVNGTYAHATEYEDDTFPEGVSTYTLIPPLLAVAEARHLPGGRLLRALVLGHEIQSRLGLACVPALARGYQLLPFLGTIASAGAVAYLIGLSERQIAMALCIATSQAAGLRVQNISMTHYLESGTAARAGVLSALLAEAGFDAAIDVFDDPTLGLMQLLTGQGTPPAEDVLHGWGSPYRLNEVSIKVYPMCMLLQPVVEAVDILRSKREFEIEDVARLDLIGSATLAEVCDNPSPRTHSEAAMSAQHVAAAALVDPGITLDTFGSACVTDANMVALRSRISVVVDPQWTPGFMTAPLGAVLHLESGEAVDALVVGARGMPPRTLGHDDVVRKFRVAGGRHLSSSRLRRIEQKVDDFEGIADAGSIMRLLVREDHVGKKP
jgi:2-methylcitrate dehydratase